MPVFTNRLHAGYGTWSYAVTAVGKRYYIVTGNQATGTFHQVVYYYERKIY